MPVSAFTANVGLTYPLLENADDDGQPVDDASVNYTNNDASVQLNAPGFVTKGGNTVATHSFTALANGSAQITAVGTDAAGDEVDAALNVTCVTVETGTIVPGGGIA
jgi:hypothetical protein